MPMGERPAATVIRRSKRVNNDLREPEDSKDQRCPLSPEPKKIIGEIVERPLRQSMNQFKKHQSTWPQSRFSQLHKGSACQSSAFPSTKVPLGTFTQQKSQSLASSDMKKAHQRAKEGKPSPGDRNSSLVSDADAMLSQMSMQEILEQKKELEGALSHETIEFLRNRGRRKGKESKSTTKTYVGDTAASEPANERKEKERLANVISSISTLDELDEAYLKEIGPRKPENGLEGKSDWDKACSLLRSTAPRQTLWAARVICIDLERDCREGNHIPLNADNCDWPYPILLPVSLRCLLDSPVTHTNGLLLHVHTLRALYALMKLRAPVEHVVDFSKDALESPPLLYQDLFFDDALPTLPYGSVYPPADTTTIMSNASGNAIAYTTSSVSAQKDGEAFLDDPSWTLMSKMRIIPRLAQLLECRHELPKEGLVAICGILSMLSVRSAGSASAIARHSTLLPSLLRQTVMPPIDEKTTSHFLEPSITFPIMLLLNNMARQSRHVASQIPYIDFLLPLLGIDATGSKHLLEVQKWALFFWRKLLRYGLGLSGLSSLVPLSIQHISTGSGLAPGYCTLFGAWIDCVKVFERSTNVESLKSSLKESELKILSSTLSWLEPSVRQCVDSLGQNYFPFDHSTLSLEASKMRLVGSFLAASIDSATINESLRDLLAILAERVLGMLNEIKISRLLENVFFKSTKQGLSKEMSTCRFLTEILALSSIMRSFDAVTKQAKINMLQRSLRSEILICLAVQGESQHRTLEAWSKQCYFTVIKFLLAQPIEDKVKTLLRPYITNLIGQLRLGDEAKAAMLFSHEGLFRVGDTIPSPVASMFMREICASQVQLDHSYKLQHGFGITTNELGPFGLTSLLSEADKDPSNNEELLPLGRYWLWRVLSGKLDENTTSTSGVNDVHEILSCTLQLLIDLEDNPSKALDSVSKGGKIYSLMNIFLFPESIISNRDIVCKTSILWERLLTGIDPSFVNDFFTACLDHTELKNDKRRQEGRIVPKDERLLAVMTGTADDSLKTFRAIQDFLSDLCTSYLEFGAQYEEFTNIIRFFLIPQFPAKIRCYVIQRLREVAHLLILERESLDKTLMEASLQKMIIQKVPPEGEREKQEILDLLADILRTKQGGKPGDFFFLFATITLSRSLLGVMYSGLNGIENLKRRLLVLPNTTAQIILDTTSRSLQAKVSQRSGLIHTAMQVCDETRILESVGTLEEKYLDNWLTSNQK
eukprot:CAMPEP_0178903868 /NCGR_PEP_ID=MMETSP0786-20121207/5388_1 /TAXON_ID=186022 /ORGANISM="Thalassionema frauenfeldii, Strain CCMP 1798" /LENGTH=1222 /DNA_ID=CAMNT_0020575271 /DNA_START=184 /DNA_END=3852 /DNA_ORIENTATION=-